MKSLTVVPSRTAQSGAPVITASIRALSKLKLLSVSRPAGGGVAGAKSQPSGVQEYGAGAGTAAGAGGGAGRTAATGGGGGGVSATGGGGDCGGAATWLGGGGQAQEAVAISKAETIRVRTQSPLSALSRFAAGAEVSQLQPHHAPPRKSLVHRR